MQSLFQRKNGFLFNFSKMINNNDDDSEMAKIKLKF